MTDKWPPGEYRTRDGSRAYVLGTMPEMDEGGQPTYPVTGYTLVDDTLTWIATQWQLEGTTKGPSTHDLMPPPEVCWMVRYYTDGDCKGILLYQDRVSAECEYRRCMKAKGYNDVEVIRMVEERGNND